MYLRLNIQAHNICSSFLWLSTKFGARILRHWMPCARPQNTLKSRSRNLKSQKLCLGFAKKNASSAFTIRHPSHSAAHNRDVTSKLYCKCLTSLGLFPFSWKRASSYSLGGVYGRVWASLPSRSPFLLLSSAMLNFAHHETRRKKSEHFRILPSTDYLDTSRSISKMVPNESDPLYHEVSPLTVRNLNLEVTKVHFLVLFRSCLSRVCCWQVTMAQLWGSQ